MSSFLCVVACFALGEFRWESAPVDYSKTKAHNVVEQLQLKMDDGQTPMAYDTDFGYLPSLLDSLDISVDTQGLVFSKTSFQSSSITPESPRSIYFGDDVYVGSVPGGEVIELSVSDPNLGTVFYTLSQEKSKSPKFIRQDSDCFQCHVSSKTRDFPGHLVRSLYTRDDGNPIFKAGSFLTSHESPFDERWGGWYVTGTHGRARHMGNSFATETDSGAELDRNAGANQHTLNPVVKADQYLAEHSDIVALMVLEHQTQVHNLMVRANFETRFAISDQEMIDRAFDQDSNQLSDSTRRRIANIGEKLVESLFFSKELRLIDPIEGSSNFVNSFSARGPKDSMGRSLREFDLNTRLFKYPLSYMIYSDAFQSLPEEVKDYVTKRVWEILEDDEANAKFLQLTNSSKNAIRQILIETLAPLPISWKSDRSD
jgi:hypothetical protein